MKVQELIDRLADFRGDAEVVFWQHDINSGYEHKCDVVGVFRDSNGMVGINWNEGGNSPLFLTRTLTDQ